MDIIDKFDKKEMDYLEHLNKKPKMQDSARRKKKTLKICSALYLRSQPSGSFIGCIV